MDEISQEAIEALNEVASLRAKLEKAEGELEIAKLSIAGWVEARDDKAQRLAASEAEVASLKKQHQIWAEHIDGKGGWRDLIRKQRDEGWRTVEEKNNWNKVDAERDRLVETLAKVQLRENDEVERADRLAGELAEAGWKPITTAPTDGTPFIAANSFDAFRAFYDKEHHGWIVEDTGKEFNLIKYPPTHWIAIPLSRTAPETEGGK